MTTKLIILILLFGLIGGWLFAQQPVSNQSKLDLAQCITIAIKNNPDVLQSGLQVQTDKINRNTARMSMLPDLNGSANSGINNGRSIDPYTNAYSNQEIRYSGYGISSRLTLFNGLYLQNTAQQNQLLLEASKMDFENEKDKLAINIILVYLQVLNSEDLLQQAIQQAGLSAKQVERLEKLNMEGAISPYLLSDLKGQYATDQLSIINARNVLQSAKLNLCRLMNVPYDQQLQLQRMDTVLASDNLSGRKPADTYAAALQSLSLVKAADLHVISSEKGLKAAKGRLFPLLSINGNANTNYSSAAYRNLFMNSTDVPSQDYVLVNGAPSAVIRKQDNFSPEKIAYGQQLKNNVFSSFSLNLTVPIFNGSFYRNNARLADITLQNNKVIAKTTKTRLQLAIEQAYIDENTAQEKYRTLQEQVNAFTESFHSAEIRFNEGVVNSVDYLAAKNNVDRANINFISSRYELLLRRKVLDYYEGKPLW